MQKERTQNLNDKNAADGNAIIYVMSRDQRAHDNHALLETQRIAEEYNLPVVVMFNLLAHTGARSREHYEFMLSGLKELQQELHTHNIPFILTLCDSPSSFIKEAKKLRPSAIVFDYSPLKGSKEFKNKVAESMDCKCIVVDTHNIIPVWVASDHEEFAAYTFRNKVVKNLDAWLEEPAKLKKQKSSLKSPKVDWVSAEKLVSKIKSNGTKIEFEPGEKAARAELNNFIDSRLDDYAETRNNPNTDGQSNLSPYLHYGQISSLRVALELTKNHTPLLFKEAKLVKYDGKPSKGNSIDALLEEMIVRKELSDNYCTFNGNYHSYEGLKDWAKKSLEEHIHDEREYVYSLKELEDFKTHDDAWNAAQAQLRKTGKMHGYMRMYWAKKILEWSETPQLAIQHTNYLNDHYSIDGGDPNGYVGVLWSIGGLHDRAWFERPVFGKIRYMNYNGLKNKFDVETYIKTWLK